MVNAYNLVDSILSLLAGSKGLAQSYLSPSCAGYIASNVQLSNSGMSANLSLVGSCNVFGTDLQNLRMTVHYETENRVHVKIYDSELQVYQVPESVLPRPNGTVNAADSVLEVVIVEYPFSFAVRRRDLSETIFNTSGSSLIFENQYLRLRTNLPQNPVLYGLGEHTDPLMLNTTNYTRTLWSRDAGGVPPGTNLYGNHPVYFENRPASNSSHGVAFINSNGMDIKINNTKEDGQYLEFNTVGGIVDLYFMAGPGPIDVAKQYSEVTGKPAMMPYWGFGFHDCRFGFANVSEVAATVANYSAANIPLETIWTDIDYMDHYKIFTTDPENFPLAEIRDLVNDLHNRDQRYILMVDPAVAYQDYKAFNDGAALDVFLKNFNGSWYNGVVWPGVTVFPDWFHTNMQAFWNGEFNTFFNESTGIDIDGLWIDMNEAANFCLWPCNDPRGFANAPSSIVYPPPRNQSGPNSPVSVPGSMLGLPGRDLIDPPYMINNAAGSLSNHTIFTDLIHANGVAEYDTHNLYGTMMSAASRVAMLSRRPTKRPLIVTRSTFIGAGTHVAHWLGDNISNWDEYIQSIRHMLQFASIFQVPMVGADVCGFIDNTTETLCARWATLGAFYTFFRNHNGDPPNIPQEFYRWPLVADAARNAIATRYKLLDYIYTAFHKQTVDGTPVLTPMWFKYPQDPITFPIQDQFFYGPSLLISPVTAENSTNVTIYLPHSQFYDFHTLLPVDRESSGQHMTLTNINYTKIPVHILGGSIIPMRVSGANTTTALRKLGFEILIAPDEQGRARGQLYLDDGESLVQEAVSEIMFSWDGRSRKLVMDGTFEYNVGNVKILSLTVLDPEGKPLSYDLDIPLTGPATVDIEMRKSKELK
ncbi:maltase glucoamylase [Mollisia scopiformis]|uniref:Probable alpha/beta-glucosidase agdC n=1 Tax=Mollisia scopiformis TaxID=149040 RepID=A0A194XUA0_MOLSC|nr:maltase glucoamylase [Mollisia scopiformis]KUJ23716.1 maltase glucoamylase [Mollisia scopiformis]